MDGDKITVRRYEPRDRAALREIACDTADSGQPVERFFPDREVFADALTRYCTDIAPEATWVAEQNGEVVGYLTGCFDTRRYFRTMAFRIVPLAFVRALFRGALWHPLTRKLITVNLRDWFRGGRRPDLSLADYPAHVHINLRKNARGQKAGEQLLENFLRQAKIAGIRGVHAKVSEANTGARRFFERFGFAALGREIRFRFPDTPDTRTFTIIFGKRLFP